MPGQPTPIAYGEAHQTGAAEKGNQHGQRKDAWATDAPSLSRTQAHPPLTSAARSPHWHVHQPPRQDTWGMDAWELTTRIGWTHPVCPKEQSMSSTCGPIRQSIPAFIVGLARGPFETTSTALNPARQESPPRGQAGRQKQGGPVVYPPQMAFRTIRDSN